MTSILLRYINLQSNYVDNSAITYLSNYVGRMGVSFVEKCVFDNCLKYIIMIHIYDENDVGGIDLHIYILSSFADLHIPGSCTNSSWYMLMIVLESILH